MFPDSIDSYCIQKVGSGWVGVDMGLGRVVSILVDIWQGRGRGRVGLSNTKSQVFVDYWQNANIGMFTSMRWFPRFADRYVTFSVDLSKEMD